MDQGEKASTAAGTRIALDSRARVRRIGPPGPRCPRPPHPRARWRSPRSRVAWNAAGAVAERLLVPQVRQLSLNTLVRPGPALLKVRESSRSYELTLSRALPTASLSALPCDASTTSLDVSEFCTARRPALDTVPAEGTTRIGTNLIERMTRTPSRGRSTRGAAALFARSAVQRSHPRVSRQHSASPLLPLSLHSASASLPRVWEPERRGCAVLLRMRRVPHPARGAHARGAQDGDDSLLRRRRATRSPRAWTPRPGARSWSATSIAWPRPWSATAGRSRSSSATP